MAYATLCTHDWYAALCTMTAHSLQADLLLGNVSATGTRIRGVRGFCKLPQAGFVGIYMSQTCAWQTVSIHSGTMIHAYADQQSKQSKSMPNCGHAMQCLFVAGTLHKMTPSTNALRTDTEVYEAIAGTCKLIIGTSQSDTIVVMLTHGTACVPPCMSPEQTIRCYTV